MGGALPLDEVDHATGQDLAVGFGADIPHLLEQALLVVARVDFCGQIAPEVERHVFELLVRHAHAVRLIHLLAEKGLPFAEVIDDGVGVVGCIHPLSAPPRYRLSFCSGLVWLGVAVIIQAKVTYPSK